MLKPVVIIANNWCVCVCVCGGAGVCLWGGGGGLQEKIESYKVSGVAAIRRC